MAEIQHITSEISDPQMVDQQWQRLTGAVLHELHDPAVQAALMRFSGTPVDETLPGDMAVSLPDTPLLGRVRGSSPDLTAYLARPPIADERLVPDLTNAWKKYHRISDDEFDQVARRYNEARTVKVLALGAELQHMHDNSIAITPDKNGDITLASGIVLHGDAGHGNFADLLNPAKWESRVQLKDRVSTVVIDGKPFIMKEQKTSRHTDVPPESLTEHGPEINRTPAQEYAIGQTLRQKAVAEKDGVSLAWEQPIGYATFPDGFTFGVFGFEEGLIADPEQAVIRLAENIEQQPQKYAAEFAVCQQDIERFMDTPAVKNAEDATRRSLGRRALQALQLNRPAKRELTFRDFAFAKANQMMMTGWILQEENRLTAGFLDTDSDGTVYRVAADAAALEVMGLDYERYHDLSAQNIAEVPAVISNQMADLQQYRLQGHALPRGTMMERAAMLSLLEKSDPRWTAQTTASH